MLLPRGKGKQLPESACFGVEAQEGVSYRRDQGVVSNVRTYIRTGLWCLCSSISLPMYKGFCSQQSWERMLLHTAAGLTTPSADYLKHRHKAQEVSLNCN